MSGINIRPMEPGTLQRCMALAARERNATRAEELAQENRDEYARRRALKHPWLSIAEAAFELDVGEARIHQLVTDERFRAHPTAKFRRISAEDVYSYKSRNMNRKAAK